MSGQSKSLWHNRDYILLLSGQTISSIGTGVSELAFPLLMLALTGSPAQAGFAGALRLLPYFILTLPVGVLVDRWDRKRVMIFCDTGRALSLASIPIAFALGHLTVVQLYLNALIEGSLYVLFDMAETASLPRVVEKEQLPTVTGQNLATQGMSDVLGSPLGGVLYSIGSVIPFLIDAISYAFSVASLLFIGTKFQEERTHAPRKLRTELLEGLSWLCHQPLICFLAILTSGINFVFPTSTLLVIILAQRQHALPAVIGLILAFGGIGFVIGALLGSPVQKLRLAYIVMGVFWLFALLWPFFALAPNPFVLGVILACLSLIRSVYGVTQLSYRLAKIPDELQGRVNSVFRLIALGSPSLGIALTGVLIQSIGVDPAVFVFSACLIVLALAAMLNPSVRNTRRSTGVLTEQ